MRLLVHILRADVRHFRVPFLAWIGVVLAGAALNAWWPGIPSDPPSTRVWLPIAVLLGLAYGLLSVVLVPLVVHVHPAVGGDAFWMTRPIPRWALVTSRIVLLSFLLVVLPLAGDVAFMALYGAAPADVTSVALQITMFRVCILMALMAAAAITPTFARFALLCGAVLLLLAIGLAIGAALAMADIDTGDAMVAVNVLPMSHGPDQTPLVVLLVLLSGAATATVLVQYRTRHVRLSVLVGLGVAAAGCLAAAWWPWPVFYERLTVPAWAASRDTLVLTADVQSVSLDSAVHWTRGHRASWRDARATVWLEGVPPGWVATARLARATLDVAGSARVVSPEHFYWAALPQRAENVPPLQRAIRERLGVRRLVYSWPPRGENAIVFRTAGEDVPRLLSKAGSYRGQFLVQLESVDVAAVLPIEPGAAFEEGSYRFSIDDVQRDGDRVSLRARVASVSGTVFDTRPRPMYTYYFRNRLLGEAAAARPYSPDVELPPLVFGLSRPSASSLGSGFRVDRTRLTFPDPAGYPGQATALSAGWLAGAELVIVRTVSEGAVPRMLDIEGFTLVERAPLPESEGVSR